MFGGGGGFGGFGQNNQNNNNNQQQGAGLFGAGNTSNAFGQTQPTPFGQPQNQQANTGGGLFGAQPQAQPAQSSGFTFGQSTNQAQSQAPVFGQQPKPTGFGGFGATTGGNNTGGGFTFGGTSAQAQPQSTPVFGGGGFGTQQNKPAGGLFGTAPSQPTAGAFGAQPQQQAGGLFGTQTGGMPTQGSSNPPYQLTPVLDDAKEKITINGRQEERDVYHEAQCITYMPAYANMSVEEIRVQDYQQNRKTGPGGPQTGAGGFAFGQQPAQTNTGFGQSTSGGLFGNNNAQQQNNPFGASQSNTGGLFGNQQQQPQQTGGLFGQQPQQQQGGLFGSSTSSQPAQSGGLFGQQPQTQPAQSTGFSFGQNHNTNNQAGSSTAGGFSFGGAQQNQTQNKSLFGGFGQSTTQPAQQPSQPFSFGGQQQQQQPAAGAFGGASTSSNTGGLSFGAASNAPKPGGLFGTATSQPPATSAAPAFGGFGAQTNNAPKPGGFTFGSGFGTSGASTTQTSAPAQTGGLFGGSQSTTTSQPTGGLFGNNTTQAPATGGFSFGQPQQQQQQQPAATGFGGGGLFGAKPATGGLFGSTTQQTGQQNQPASTGFGGGGLFGANNNNNAAKPGGFSFGATTNNQTQGGGGLFGSNPAAGGSSLFGASQPAASTGGFSFGNSTNTGGGGLFGQSQNNNQQNQNQFQQSQNQPQQGQFQQPGLDRDPYGTDALFAQNGGVAPGQGPTIPFHLTQKKKKQPPLVVPFRSSPSNAGKITRLRGMTPSGGLGSSVSGGRSGTPGRETTPGASLFAGASVYGRSSSPALFRGFSDEQSIISPNAFVSRSSVKRLDLDPPGSTSTAGGGLGASRSMFGPRAGSVLDGSPGGGNNSFSRGGTAPITHRGVAFSPAAESASRIRQNSVLNGNLQSQNQNDPDNSFASSIAPRRGQLFSDQLPEQPLRRKELEMNQITSSTPLVNPQRKTSMPLNNANSLVNSPNTSIGGGNLGGDDSQDGKGGYYMEPSYNALRNLANDDLKEVENFVVGRKGFGKITFLKVDLSEGPKLAQIAGGVVQIRAKEVYVYPSPEDSEARNDDPPIQKAPPGKGLNVPAVVSLEKCWAVDRETREPIKDPEHIKVKHFEIRLKKREDTDFISYEATTGTWTFKVDHFSRYGLDGLDESDEGEDEELINDIASGARSAAASRSSGSRTTRSSKRFVSESEEDEDEDAPPTRRMDEASSSSQTEDEDELQSPSEMSEEMRESELGDGIPDSQKVWKQFDTVPINSTPRVNNRINRERSSTPRGGSGLSPATSRRGERGTSQTPQPWAATLGLEARRVQVMQASFFGQEKEKEVVRNNASTIPSSSIVPPPSLSKNNNQNQRKHPLSTSSSQKRLENLASGSAAQRQNFSSPIRTTNQNQISNNDPSSDLIIPPARKLNRSDLAQSVVKGSDGIFVDAGLALGRSFRVGWGPDGSIVHNGKLVGASAGASFVDSARAQASSSKSIPSQSLSTLKIQKLKIFKHGSEQEVNKADRLLQCQLAQSVILYDTDSECPEIRPHEEVRFSNFSAAFERDDRSQEASLWRLGMALFDEIDLKLADNTPEDVVERVKSLRRKAALSAWLSHTVSSTVEIESRSHVAASRDEALVFSYLTGHQLERACSSALDSGNLRLATLLAQIGGGDSTFRQDINEQLSTWRTEGVDAHITKDHRRIYELLAGNVTLSQGTASRSVREAIDQVGDLQIAGGLDWKRALGLHLWYEVPASASLIAAFERYEKAIGGPGGTAPPLPPYRESASVGSLARQKIIQSGDYDKDALYHLIKLYAQPTHDLESALDPHSFGPDSADYRLPWHLYCLLSSVLGVRDFWDRPDIGEDEETQYGSRADGLTSSYAAQLELQGQWTWSAFVLLHLQLSDSREKAIKSLLNRNVSSLNQESEDFLSQKLSIPLEWIYESKAIEAKSRDAKWEEYELWLKAKQWEQAHIVARDYLAPEALSRGETTLLTQMFAPLPLDDGAHGGKDEKGELPGWRSGGRVFVDYAFCKKNALKITKAWKLSDGKNERINNEVENMSKIVGELLELTPGLFNDVENNISHAMARSDMLVSLHTIAREISACLPPSAPEPVVTWDKVSKPEVEAVQNTADDYLNLLVGTS